MSHARSFTLPGAAHADSNRGASMPDLGEHEAAVRNPFAFDRRAAERLPASGPLQAVLANGRDMPWVMRLSLINASSTGLCVTNDAPIAPGARLSMRVDPVHGGWKTGVVVRCTPTKAAAPGTPGAPGAEGTTDLYEIGISYELKSRAA